MEAARPKDPETARRTSTAQWIGDERGRNATKEELGPQRFPDRGPDLLGVVRGALPGAVLRVPGLLLRVMVVRRVLGLFGVHARYVVAV